MRCVPFAVVLGLLCAVPALADLLPPNSKRVSHVLRFENIKDYADYAFYVYPRDLARGKPGNSSVRVDDSGEVNYFGNPLARRNGTYLYAIPRKLFKDDKQPPQEEWFEKPANGILKSERLVNQVRILPNSDPRTKIVTRYKIEIKDGLKLTQLAEEKPAKPAKPEEEETSVSSGRRGTIALGFGLAGLASCLGLAVTRWRARAQK